MLLALVVATLLAKPSTPSLPLKDTVAPFLAAKPAPQFPDMRDNYKQTVVLPEKARQEALEVAERAKQAALLSATTQPPNTSPAPVTQATGHVLAAQQYAQSLVPADQWPCLLQLWNKESGWNDMAVNPTSGAMGIPQALGHGNVFALGDYKAQVSWGLQYIANRYGNACTAWGHSVQTGWY